MCCRLIVTPLNEQLAITLLPVGLFIFNYNSWRRDIPEEHAAVIATLDTLGFHLSISPPIYRYSEHHGKRITAGVYFEMAVRYAEKCDGRIVQTANVIGCTDGSTTKKLLAQYPDFPLDWNSVCNGFQEEIMGLGAY